jgi:chromosome partitioning protein
MTIYVVANKKGGIGKSTTAVQLVTGLSLTGRRVWAVDGDADQTSMLLALTVRANSGFPGIAACELSDGATLRQQVKLQAALYDDVVIDVGAKDSGALRAALTVADVLVIPFAPRTFDVWAFENMHNLVTEIQAMRDFKVVAFLNKADPAHQDADNKQAIQDISAYGYQIAPVAIGDRKALAHASARGLHVSEFEGADSKLRGEFAGLQEFITVAAQLTPAT